MSDTPKEMSKIDKLQFVDQTLSEILLSDYGDLWLGNIETSQQFLDEIIVELINGV